MPTLRLRLCALVLAATAAVALLFLLGTFLPALVLLLAALVLLLGLRALSSLHPLAALVSLLLFLLSLLFFVRLSIGHRDGRCRRCSSIPRLWALRRFGHDLVRRNRCTRCRLGNFCRKKNVGVGDGRGIKTTHKKIKNNPYHVE